MRKRIPKITFGDTRIVTKFLFLPKTMRLPNSEDKEQRWLERTSWVQTYRPGYLQPSFWGDTVWETK